MTTHPFVTESLSFRAARALAAVAVTFAMVPAGAQIAVRATAQAAPVAPFTRAERTGFRETSTYADVVAFIDSLRASGAAIHVDTLGRTTEGRWLPLVIASRPLVTSAAAARRTGRPIVYVQANIHAGEVEGKEAMQALLRDLTRETHKNVLDSIVLVVIPIYNADGNEKFAAQDVNRTEQNGPESVGQRPNAMGLDLNRDYIKAEAPETRASLAAFAAWDPHVFVDLHTTDGSFHGYALTYSPSLSPAAALTPFVRDTLLPELRARVRTRQRFETFDYGNFAVEYGADVNTDTTKQGWYTYDHRPRFGTNYYGLRGRVSILSEAYSHDPFERRVRATYAYVRELLSLVNERGKQIRAMEQRADAAFGAPRGPWVPVRATLTRAPRTLPVIAEDLVRDSTGMRTQPGVPIGLRRSGRYRTITMGVYDRFDPTDSVYRPFAYVLDSSLTDAVALLRRHGVHVEQLTAPALLAVSTWTVDSVVRGRRPFQGHLETRLTGHGDGATVVTASPPTINAAAGTYIVSTTQPLGTLVMYLLEPTTDDGVVTWNGLDKWLAPGQAYPVRRLLTLVKAARREVP
jgi:hypothetical protein